MPTKRRTPKTREYPITPEAVAAYRAGDRLTLHRALGLRLWQHSPLDVKGGQRPAWFDAVDWELQCSLRDELEAAHAD